MTNKSKGALERKAVWKQRVLEVLAAAPEPLSSKDIRARLFQGRHVSGEAVAAALRALVAQGRALTHDGVRFSLPPLAP